jgi:hypothetical protein
MVSGGTSKPNMALHRTPLRSAGELYRYARLFLTRASYFAFTSLSMGSF